MLSLLFLTHQALVLVSFVLFFHSQFLCQQASSPIHHSFQSAVNSISIPAFAPFPFPVIFCYFLSRWFSTPVSRSSRDSLVLLSYIHLDIFSACSFNGSYYKRSGNAIKIILLAHAVTGAHVSEMSMVPLSATDMKGKKLWPCGEGCPHSVSPLKSIPLGAMEATTTWGGENASRSESDDQKKV